MGADCDPHGAVGRVTLLCLLHRKESLQTQNLANRVGVEAMSCCFWQGNQKRAEFGVMVHYSDEYFNSSRSADPVACADRSFLNASKRR